MSQRCSVMYKAIEAAATLPKIRTSSNAQAFTFEITFEILVKELPKSYRHQNISKTRISRLNRTQDPDSVVLRVLKQRLGNALKTPNGRMQIVSTEVNRLCFMGRPINSSRTGLGWLHGSLYKCLKLLMVRPKSTWYTPYISSPCGVSDHLFMLGAEVRVE